MFEDRLRDSHIHLERCRVAHFNAQREWKSVRPAAESTLWSDRSVDAYAQQMHYAAELRKARKAARDWRESKRRERDRTVVKLVKSRGITRREACNVIRKTYPELTLPMIRRIGRG